MSGAIFLDRDGVINRKRPDGDYVRTWADFEFLPGAIEALQLLAGRGRGPLIVVSNQRGIARGLMSQAAVDDIHDRMRATLAAAGVTLAGIHICPHEIGVCLCRKPGTGLFVEAARLDPTLELDRSAVVGDSLADLEAGHRIGADVFAISSDPDGLVNAASARGITVTGAALVAARAGEDRGP